MERLQKVIAQFGYCSRRKAEELISNGKVEVNGTVVREMGVKVSYEDDIVVEGNQLLKKEDKVYFLLNKPRGVLSTAHDEKDRKTVVDLIDTTARIYPVGRLDYDTTGILILTNDGDLTNILTHPKNQIDKVYIAKIKGFLTPDNLKKLSNGVMIDNFKTSKAKVKVKKYDKNTDTSLIEITIHEGKNHQVKKMLEKVNLPVIKLTRERIAFLNVDDLKSGEYRKLSKKEVSQLYDLVNKKLDEL